MKLNGCCIEIIVIKFSQLQIKIMLFFNIIFTKFLNLFLEIDDFQKIVGGFLEMVDSLAKEVESEKMKVSLIMMK